MIHFCQMLEFPEMLPEIENPEQKKDNDEYNLIPKRISKKELEVKEKIENEKMKFSKIKPFNKIISENEIPEQCKASLDSQWGMITDILFRFELDIFESVIKDEKSL